MGGGVGGTFITGTPELNLMKCREQKMSNVEWGSIIRCGDRVIRILMEFSHPSEDGERAEFICVGDIGFYFP